MNPEVDQIKSYRDSSGRISEQCSKSGSQYSQPNRSKHGRRRWWPRGLSRSGDEQQGQIAPKMKQNMAGMEQWKSWSRGEAVKESRLRTQAQRKRI